MAGGARAAGDWAAGGWVAAGREWEEAGAAMEAGGWEAAGCRRDVRGRQLNQYAHAAVSEGPMLQDGRLRHTPSAANDLDRSTLLGCCYS